jgi:ACS family tartrate transporter-like MFS transporter
MKPLYWKITLRIVPFLMVLYLVAFLDRVNIGFAALTMNRDLNIGETLFGVAAGMFFLGYFLFEVPSNMILVRLGARRWITIIMIVWGLLSVATAFVHGPASYISLRFLLGLAEAGFYPGVILYLTFWLPASVRASVMALFATAIPFSNFIGAPVSAYILSLNNVHSLQGWQWLFLLEGSPAILLGTMVFFVLPDRPEEVDWLSDQEKASLRDALRADVPHGSRGPADHSILKALTSQSVLYAWSLVYFCLALGLYGLGFWIPKILVSHGLNLASTGWATALPYVAGIIGMMLWSRSSDRLRERRIHLSTAYLTSGIGFLIAGLAPSATIAIVGFSLGAIGVLAGMPIFWGASTLQLAGPMVGAYIAIINSIGNLGGLIGPILMGWLLQTTSSYTAGLSVMDFALAVGAFTAFRICPASASKTAAG